LLAQLALKFFETSYGTSGTKMTPSNLKFLEMSYAVGVKQRNLFCADPLIKEKPTTPLYRRFRPIKEKTPNLVLGAAGTHIPRKILRYIGENTQNTLPKTSKI
jgi:hypothetical protein